MGLIFQGTKSKNFVDILEKIIADLECENE